MISTLPLAPPFILFLRENTFFKNNFLHFLIFGNFKKKLVEEKIFFSGRKIWS
jgi:hypothetical protein